jgi:2-keto-3-deoxy-L-rhamnonate aldolase RhmA
MLGPADFFASSAAFPGRWNDPCLEDAKRKMADAADGAGKAWACPALSVDDASELLTMGARLICYQADILMIKSGLERIQREMTPQGFTFANVAGTSQAP